jgi:aldose 1-epimerase
MTELINISNDTLRLCVSPGLGGSIISFEALINGHWQAFLRPGNNAEHVLSTAGFPMVPFCNRVRNGHFHWQDQAIKLTANHPPEPHAIHGFGWQQPWAIEHISLNQILLSQNEDGQKWPFKYFTSQLFTLCGNSLRVEMTVTNHSDQSMPAGLGFHPYFPLTPDVRLMTDCSEQWLVDDESMPTSRIPAPYAMTSLSGFPLAHSSLDNLFEDFDGHAKLIWPDSGTQMDIRASSDCRFLQIFTPDNEDYFCVEPQSMCVDGFNRYQNGDSNTGVVVLAPGETLSIWMELSPAKL